MDERYSWSRIEHLTERNQFAGNKVFAGEMLLNVRMPFKLLSSLILILSLDICSIRINAFINC